MYVFPHSAGISLKLCLLQLEHTASGIQKGHKTEDWWCGCRATESVMQYQNWIWKENTTGMTKDKEEENEVLHLKCWTIRQQWKLSSNSSSRTLHCSDRWSFCRNNIHYSLVHNINTYGKQVTFEFIRNVHVCNELELSLTSCDDVWCQCL
jgi:hypothetical protein